jgi:uncharacterized phage protein (TIGR01671 family)
MREIKFRVWNKAENEFSDISEYGPWYWFDRYIDPKIPKTLTFQQYTGVKDRAGVEIYEGDIIKYGMSYDQEKPLPKLRFVEFYEPQLIYKIVEVGDHPVSVDYLYEAIGASTRWCEVIGNIFENPELLKA